jgi:CarD family transcriptional regulator
MYKVGEYVMYGINGICKVDDITHLDISASTKDILYYALIPLNDVNGKVYFPVDNDRIVVRKVLTNDEAWKLIDEIPNIQEMSVENEKQCEGMYRGAMKSCDCHQWVQIIKTSYNRREARIKMGKKVTTTDDKYFKQAKESLYSELAFAIGKDKSEMEDIISERIMTGESH